MAGKNVVMIRAKGGIFFRPDLYKNTIYVDPAGAFVDLENVDSSLLRKLSNLARDYAGRKHSNSIYKGDGKINIFSGYRSYSYQKKLYDDAGGNNGQRMVGSPEGSRHRFGGAVDISSMWIKELAGPEKNNKKNWENANKILAKYGLIKPMSWEDWHIEESNGRNKISSDISSNIEIPDIEYEDTANFDFDPGGDQKSTRLLLSKDYTLNEVQGLLNELYDNSPQVIKNRSNKIKDIVKKSELFISEHYIREE